MSTMTSTETFSLLLLAAFVVGGRSIPYNDANDDVPSLDQLSNNNEVEMTFLESNIFGGSVSSVHLCDDPYEALCGDGKAKNYTRPFHLKQAYPYMRDHLIYILSQPVGPNEVRALSIEKTLFDKCMHLGFRQMDAENVRATMSFLNILFENVLDLPGASWQNIDNKLDLRGFDYTFFDIGVECDRENPKQNIIVLQPPSPSHIQALYDSLAIVFDVGNSQHISRSLASKFFDNVKTEAVQHFFHRWTKVFLESPSQDKREKINLIKWNREYNAKSSDRATSKINWLKLIKQNFGRVEIDIAGSENIIIKNKDYFLSLTDLLGNTTNDAIVDAIKTKLILENIRYIDYAYADTFTHRKRSLFCYSNTKLYGASFRVLRGLKKEDSNNAPNYDILDTMLGNIADVFQFAINDSSELTPKEKAYLHARVNSITLDCVRHNKYRRIVDDYYEDYEVSPSYFASIANYRKMLKEKVLSSLERPNELEPFSLIDLAKPRNRFILSVFANSALLSKLPVPGGLQKEVYYGIYGVKIASFLYGILNENKSDNEVNLTRRVDWYDHPNYPAKALQCFVGEDIRSYGWGLATETVTQVFGAHIAYKAMLKDYAESQVKRPKEYFIASPDSELIPLQADQLFFRSYGKYHCDFGPKVLRTILLNLEEYNSTFECALTHGDFTPKCRLNGFQIQKKGYFVDKTF